MTTINNPITKEGKVKCIHYYELCLKNKWYNTFIAIFIHENRIYMYKVEDPIKLTKTLIDFGEVSPENMTKAVKTFKENII